MLPLKQQNNIAKHEIPKRRKRFLNIFLKTISKQRFRRYIIGGQKIKSNSIAVGKSLIATLRI
jgi:hypothetical protein